MILHLIQENDYSDKIMVSHDIHTKHRLVSSDGLNVRFCSFQKPKLKLWLCNSRSFDQEINFLFIVLYVRKSLVDMDTNMLSSISEIGWS